MKTPKRRDLIGEVSPAPTPPTKRKGKTLQTGRKPGSGRPVGSKDQVLEELRVAIVHVYEKLGGEAWLERFSREYPEAFATKILNRILPPVPREPEFQIQQNTVNVNDMSDFEVARRVAFLLASGQHALDQQRVEERLIEAAPVRPSPAMIPLPPVEYPSQFSEAELHELTQKRQDNALVADTLGGPNDYHGSAAEQGRGRRRKLI